MIQKSCACTSQSSRILGEEGVDPYEILEAFFCDTNYTETGALFDKVLETCLTTDEGPFSKGEERSQLLAMRKRVLQVLEACQMIVQEERQD